MLPDYLIYAMPMVAVLLTALQFYRKPKPVSKCILAVSFCAFYAVVVALASGAPLNQSLFIMGAAVIGTNLIYSYSSHKADFLVGIAAIIFGFAYWSAQPLNIMPFMQAVAVGSLLAVILKFGYAQKTNRDDKRLERRRDVFQIGVGAVALLAFLLVPQYSYTIVFLLVLFGYAVSGLMLGSRAAGPLKALERKGTVFGAGAIYMAIGAMLILGSVPNYNYALVGLVALLICDAVATIVGVRGRHRLPYNKEKTMEGTLAYFIVLAVIGFAFISYYALLFAAVLALLESVIQSVDDNIAVPIAAIVLYYII